MNPNPKTKADIGDVYSFLGKSPQVTPVRVPAGALSCESPGLVFDA